MSRRKLLDMGLFYQVNPQCLIAKIDKSTAARRYRLANVNSVGLHVRNVCLLLLLLLLFTLTHRYNAVRGHKKC